MFNSLIELMDAKELADKRSIPWNQICQEEQLSERFIKDNLDQVNWKLISRFQELSEGFIRKYRNRLFWDEIIQAQKLSETFIEKYADKKKWRPIAAEELSKKQQKTVDKEGKPFDGVEYWKLVSAKQQLANSKGLSPAFIEKHQHELSWPELCRHQHLPMPLIDRHARQVDWTLVTRHQTLSERFIEKHSRDIEWETLSFHQSLSERFINRHHAKMSFISAEEGRSESFLYTHFNKLDAASILEHQQLREVKKYEPLDVYVLTKNGQKKYILKFHGLADNLEPIRKADEEELYEQLEENDLLATVEEDFPELMIIGDIRF
ncbi:hypothetical protein QOZ98_002642 [Planomicrobium stackebrandtii]|uniref:Uncharacterized protein n=1 Tax=Planomicrobium stackebrandtii TaxID=253160 RepID=A0ABU0GWQ9_9BACL|nr:hypothetical protein [Planomicrobium stackebrandtii]MDQ0429814.1 hypothetical protein [Planomicrobium stackebrandtii]